MPDTAPRPAVQLTVREPGLPERTLSLTVAATPTAGRDPECEIRLDDPGRRASRRHCRVVVDPPELSVHDLGSRNGTIVNGRRVEACALADGDEVRVGGVAIVVTVVGALPRCPGYVLLDELGRGAQGVVHRAREDATGDLVAVKVLAPDGPLTDGARRAFVREMECTRALRHPHVVGFRGAGVDADGSAPFFAADLCAGGTLEAHLDARGGRLDPQDAVALVTQLLAGLEHAHDAPLPASTRTDGTSWTGRGLVHRDVHPRNVLLTDVDGARVRLADLGLAKAYDLAGWSGHTPTGALGGSPAFMPRRQLADYRGAGPDVDVWAAAAVLYRMLTGHTPRDFPPSADPVAVVLREPVVPVADRDAAVPAALRRVLDDVLAADTHAPRDGPGRSAAALRYALEDALGGRP